MDFKDPALKQKNGPAPRSGLGGLKREWSNPDADLNGSGKSTATKGKEVIDLSGDDDGIPVKKQRGNGFTNASSLQRTSSNSSPAPSSSAATSQSGKRGLPSLFTKNSSQIKADKGKEKAASGSGQNALNFPNKKANIGGVFLSVEQRKILNCVVDEGKSVFFTGSAGTGKSVLLREIITGLRRKHAAKPDAVAVTASTGIAACNIGGVTLHSFSGIGLGVEDASILIQKIRKNKKAASRWLRTSVLIIDEISMVDPILFDKLEQIARTLRKKPDVPFGGLQVIITGDFFQLPPVIKGGETRFAFQAKTWDQVMNHKFNLTQVFRQQDPTFINMLNEMRYGKLSSTTIAAFSKLKRSPQTDTFDPTELYPRREDVESANKRRMDSLKGEIWSHTAFDHGDAKICDNFLALRTVTLRVGAQVMLIKNLDDTLVNGSIGTVMGFYTQAESNALEVTPSGIAPGTIYKELKELEEAEADVIPDVKPDVKSKADKNRYPLVRFLQRDGGFRTYLTTPESWKNELPNGEIVASRSQIPLVLAWAMSIHKAQGQTLPYCRINLSRIFEKGQAYVALSRATSLEGLQVIGFDPAKVQAHPTVVQYYNSLTTISNNASSSSSSSAF